MPAYMHVEVWGLDNTPRHAQRGVTADTQHHGPGQGPGDPTACSTLLSLHQPRSP